MGSRARAGGRAYHITDGARTTCGEFYGRLAAATGRRPVPTAPGWVVFGVLGALEGVSALRGRPLALRDTARFLARPGVYSIEKAQQELAYKPRVTLEDGIAAIARAAGALDGSAGPLDASAGALDASVGATGAEPTLVRSQRARPRDAFRNADS